MYGFKEKNSRLSVKIVGAIKNVFICVVPN